MLYSFLLLDKPAASDLRLQMRPQHKAYLALTVWPWWAVCW